MFRPASATDYNALQDELRCNYEVRIPYRDPAFAILFAAQLCVVCGTALFYAYNVHSDVVDGGIDPGLTHLQWPVIFTVVIGIVSAIMFGLSWIKFLQSHADSVIHLSVMTNIGVQACIGMLALLCGVPGLSFFMIISAGLIGLWYFFVRDRTKFVSVLLELSVSAINRYPAMIWTSLVFQVVAVLWVGIWVTAVLAVASLSSKSEDNGWAGFCSFLLLLSLFWTIEVLRNSILTTSAGVYGTYYFFGVTRNPTWKSAKRTCTTSFGSVCLGSLLVSIIETLRTLFRSQRDRNNGNSCMDCILGCIESLTAYISKFAFTRVAIFGENFMTAARNTFDMFKSKGIDVLISDDLSGFALVAGAVLGGAVSGLTAAVLALIMLSDATAESAAVIGIACFVIGSGVVSIMLSVLTSGVATFIVLWADEPQALQTNHPHLYAKLASTVRSQFPAFSQPIV